MKQDSVPSRTSKRSSNPPLLPRGIILATVVVAMLSLSSTTSAFQTATTITTSTKQRSGTSTILHYRHLTADYDNTTEEDQPILMQLANGNLAMTEGTIVSSSASSFLQMMAAQDKDLSEMDEYLEYVDKRYARMHPPNPNNQHHEHEAALSSSLSSPAAVVATAVHMSTSSTTASARTNNEDDDDKVPLKKLGLSRLASARLRNRLLRQQHHTKNNSSLTMTLLVRCVKRFLKPLSYLCGVLVVVSTFVRGGGNEYT